MQESELLIYSAYENTLNLGHHTPPAEDLNWRELRSGRFYHNIPQERDPIQPYQGSLSPPTSMTQQSSHILGGGDKTSIVGPIAQTVKSSQKKASTKPIWDVMIEANQLATDCIKTLKDTNWIENSQMSEDNLKKFLEFLFYQFSYSREGSSFFSHFKL